MVISGRPLLIHTPPFYIFAVNAIWQSAVGYHLLHFALLEMGSTMAPNGTERTIVDSTPNRASYQTSQTHMVIGVLEQGFHWASTGKEQCWRQR